MNSRIRLKSKMLILDKTMFLALIFLTAIRLVVSMNLLPIIVRNVITQTLKNQNEILSIIIELTLSFAILISSILIFNAFYLGVDRYFFKLSQNQDVNFKTIFYYFSLKRVFSAAWFGFRLLTLKFAIFIFCQLPSIFVFSIVIYKLSTTISVAVLFSLILSGSVLLISGTVFFKLITSSLFLVKYYFINGESKSFMSAINRSQQATSHFKNADFSMCLSFTAWFISCFFILPIIYVWSYYRQSKAVLATTIMRR